MEVSLRNETTESFFKEYTTVNSTDAPNVMPNETTDPMALEDTSALYARAMTELIQLYALELFGPYHHMHLPVMLAVCLVGLATNTFNIIVFTRKNMRNSVNFFLTALSVADIGVMCTQLPYCIHHLFGFRSLFTLSWVKAYICLIFFEYAATMACNWLAVTIGVWRYVAVGWPLKARVWCTMKRAKYILIIVTVFSFVVTAPVFVFLSYGKYHIVSTEYTIYAKEESAIGQLENRLFLRIFWGITIIAIFSPCVLLVVITFLFARSLLLFRLKRLRNFQDQSQEVAQTMRAHRTTVMLTVVLVLFVVNNLPDSAMVLAAFFKSGEFDRSTVKATEFLRLFSMVNNSFSFFIYYFMGENFRTTFKKRMVAMLRTCPCFQRVSSDPFSLTLCSYKFKKREKGSTSTNSGQSNELEATIKTNSR